MPERRDQWSDLGADHAGDDADGGARPEIIGKLVVKSRVKCWLARDRRVALAVLDDADFLNRYE